MLSILLRFFRSLIAIPPSEMSHSIENISDCEYRLFGHPQHQSLAVSLLVFTATQVNSPLHRCLSDGILPPINRVQPNTLSNLQAHPFTPAQTTVHTYSSSLGVRRPLALRHSHSLIERSVFIRRVCVRDRQSCLSLWLLGLAFLLLGRRLRCGRRRALALALRHRLLLLLSQHSCTSIIRQIVRYSIA